MVDVFTDGLRPTYISELSEDEERRALLVCPGIAIDYAHELPLGSDLSLAGEWGPILDVLEGSADNHDIRFNSSSGGVVTALAAFGISSKLASSVLQIGASKVTPYKNETRLNYTVEEVLDSTGSRYAPASPCEKLHEVASSKGRCIVIGKPCDIAAVHKARKLLPGLDEKILLTVSIFCAATPSTQGTTALIRELGETNLSKVKSLRYRGFGWPGNVRIESEGDDADANIIVRERSYGDAWGGTLSQHRQWRCNLCADHTGEFSDISVGDPWYREVKEGEAGSSLIISRSKIGAEFIEKAKAAGSLSYHSVENTCLPRSQPYLTNVAGMIWGRILALKIASLFGAGYPELEGKKFFQIWLKRLTLKEKVVSVLGTFRRIRTKKLCKKNTNLESEEVTFDS
jgi:coenzyme F420 hydrogenase subunit beta